MQDIFLLDPKWIDALVSERWALAMFTMAFTPEVDLRAIGHVYCITRRVKSLCKGKGVVILLILICTWSET